MKRHDIVRLVLAPGLVLGLALLAGAPSAADAAFKVRPGIGFLAVTSSEGGAFVLEDRHHGQVDSGPPARLGSLVFRDLRQGKTYVVRHDGAGDSKTVRVLAFGDPVDTALYDRQHLVDGY